MADFVENVLRSAAEKEAKYKSIEVRKPIDLEIDDGNLLTSDPNPIDVQLFRSNREEYLKSLTRDNTQLLINKLWELPTEKLEDVVVAKLPDPKTLIPREKPVPKANPATKWEQYARMKGIKKRKKSRMVWDEQSKEYKPRWGYKRAGDDTKDWLIEVPQNVDPNEDQFEKRKKAKQERTAKNELQRLRNIARSQKSKVPGVGLTPTDTPSKDHVTKALALAKTSTASLGKFTEKLPQEKPARNMGKKRKFEPNYGNMKTETSRQLELLKNLNSNKTSIDVTRATNYEMVQEERQPKKRREEKRKGGKRSKHGGKGSFKQHRGGAGKMRGGGKRGRRK